MKNLLLAILAILFFTGCIATTQTGRSQLMLMDEKEEISIGEQGEAEILKKVKISANKAQTKQVVRVGQKIAKAANKPNYDWKFYLIEDDILNAFCLPGGKIFVYTGMMKMISNDDELATVMGHEVAHALLRHGAEGSSMSKVQGVLGAAINVGLGIFAPEYQKVGSYAYNLGSNVGVMLPYSRSHELEADEVGLTLMKNAGYNPKFAITFWQKMSEQTSNGSDFFSTHPSNEKRIKQLQELINK